MWTRPARVGVDGRARGLPALRAICGQVLSIENQWPTPEDTCVRACVRACARTVQRSSRWLARRARAHEHMLLASAQPLANANSSLGAARVGNAHTRAHVA